VLAYPKPNTAWAVCGDVLGAGAEYKSLYQSTDGGRTWRLLVKVDTHHESSHGLSMGGYPGGLSFSGAGLGVLLDSYPGPIHVTRDGGANWEVLPRIVGVATSIVSGTNGFVLDYEGRLLATHDAGQSWQAVHEFAGRQRYS